MNHSLKIVYMGTPDFAVMPLMTLIKAGYEIVGVVTNPDKPAGRGQKIQKSAVKICAEMMGLRVLQPEKFRDEAFLDELASLKADLQVVVAFKMLPEVVWAMPRLGTINLHASLLPDYRGAAPINWAIMNGETETGVSTFLLSHEIDAGNLICRQEVPIFEAMTAGELHDVLMEVGSAVLLETVERIEVGKYSPIDQQTLLEGRAPKLAPKIFKPDMRIDWSASVQRVYDHIRGLSPYPSAWTALTDGSSTEPLVLKVFSATCVEGSGVPGEIRTDGKTYLYVCLSDGMLSLDDVQLAGKKRMQIAEFLRGFKIEGWKMAMDN